jgi:hypothetical protein
MSKQPFYQIIPQAIYEILQRYPWVPLVGSLGIAVWALFLPGLAIPGSEQPAPPTLAAVAWLPTDTPITPLETEVVVSPPGTLTWIPPTTEILLPTPTAWFVPTEVLPTESVLPYDPEFLPLSIFDPFDLNERGWFEGQTDETYIVGNAQITEGVYRWDFTAVQAIHFRVSAGDNPITDAYLAVETRRAEGAPVTSGLTFGETEASKFYYFWINDARQEYGLAFSSPGTAWETLIAPTSHYIIRPGEINRLGLMVTGSLIQFYINDRFVGEISRDSPVEGWVGVAIELFNVGDEVRVEFDNFELRSAAQPTPLTAQTATSTPTLTPSASPSPTQTSVAPPTNPPQPTRAPTKKPAPKPTKTPAPPGGATPAPP